MIYYFVNSGWLPQMDCSWDRSADFQTIGPAQLCYLDLVIFLDLLAMYWQRAHCYLDWCQGLTINGRNDVLDQHCWSSNRTYADG